MISISRSILLALALLALPVGGAVAQQNDSAMKSSKDTTGYTKPTITTPTGNSSMKGATVGDSANKAAAGSTNSKADVGEFYRAFRKATQIEALPPIGRR